MSHDSHLGLHVCHPPHHALHYHRIFSNWALTYTNAWSINSNYMEKSALCHTYTFASVIQRTHFLTCIFHFTLPTRLLCLTDTTQGRGASGIGSGNLSCEPKLLTRCLIFIATLSQVPRKVCSGLLQTSSGEKKRRL